MMGGQTTYLPIKVNTAGVMPIIFAWRLIYFPAQIAVLFNIGWITAAAYAMSTRLDQLAAYAVLIVFFAYFYTSMVFNPDETGDNLSKQGGFIPGVRPGSATTAYIKNAINRVTLPALSVSRLSPLFLRLSSPSPVISLFRRLAALPSSLWSALRSTPSLSLRAS